MHRSAAYDRLGRIRDEMEAAHFALETIIQEWQRYQLAATRQATLPLSISVMRKTLQQLQSTYILRLFAAWEAILRDYWEKGLQRQSDPTLKQLIDSLAARRNVDPTTLTETHALRDFRNEIVHEDERELKYRFADCARSLGTFISYLPVSW